MKQSIVTRIVRAAAAAFVAGAALGSAPAAAAPDCDRACLKGMVDAYVDALLAHDTARLPLAPDVRVTENSKVIKLGEGIWSSATGKGTFRHDYLDVEKQVAAAHVHLMKGKTPILHTVVLHLDDGKISGMELQVEEITPEDPFQPKVLDQPVRRMDDALPSSERMSRADMIATALRYTEGLRIGNFDDAGVPFEPLTYRVENGVITAGDGCFSPTECRLNHQRIMLHPEIIPSVVAVDEENGTVLLWMNFGDTGSYGEDIALVTYEAFKMWGGKIRTVNAFFTFLPSSTPRWWNSEEPIPHKY
ncbi:hypothetical protein [Tsuneonella sp. HG222]